MNEQLLLEAFVKETWDEWEEFFTIDEIIRDKKHLIFKMRLKRFLLRYYPPGKRKRFDNSLRLNLIFCFIVKQELFSNMNKVTCWKRNRSIYSIWNLSKKTNKFQSWSQWLLFLSALISTVLSKKLWEKNRWSRRRESIKLKNWSKVKLFFSFLFVDFRHEFDWF